MDIVKWLLPCISTSKRKTKNKSNRSASSIEIFSNEIFYEIFDYLDGIDIYETFSNLNYRFQQLLNSSFFLFKIKCYSNQHESQMNQVLLNHKHQIFCMNLCPSLEDKDYFSSFTFDSSLNRLESLVIGYSELEVLTPLLISLASLSRLFSLKIETRKISEDLHDIYRLIFALPALKCNKLYICTHNTSALSPMIINQISNTIEYLTINHSCTFNELLTIISNTPQLRRLTFSQLYKDDEPINIVSPIILSNLTDICLRLGDVIFNELEIFFTKIHSKLKILRLDLLSHDIAYLDAYRWEQLILQYFPQLEKFYLQYCEYSNNVQEYPIHSGRPNQFSTSFWIKRQWVCEALIDYASIMYTIHPYKKRWYEYDTQHQVVYASNERSKFNQLTHTSFSETEYLRSGPVTIDVKHVLTVIPVYHLEFFEEKTVVDQLTEVMDLLREVKTLKIYCLSVYHRRALWGEECDLLPLLKYTSKITKVYLVNMNTREEFDFLMELCPHMEFFKVDCIHYMDIEYLLQEILNKINIERHQYLRLLCFKVPAADDQMIKNLEKMINTDKLLVDYTIQRVSDDIYLQWK